MEVVVAYFKVLFQHFPVDAEENYKKTSVRKHDLQLDLRQGPLKY
jgi:hypothetical protein